MSAVHKDTLFPGSSEMARRMREFDWAQSSLGVVEKWPSSLLSTLSLCLSARFPMAIYWGRDGVLLYNDAWRPILGDKGSWALGRPAREVWPEIWDVIAPLLESVLTTGEATWRSDALLPMHRFGYTEECYFDYTFNPIRDSSGAVQGILNVVQETTYRVLSERRARLLRELASRCSSPTSEAALYEAAMAAMATDSADIPFALLYSVDNDGRKALLEQAVGLPIESSARSDTVDLCPEADARGWPLGAAVRRGAKIVDDLPERFGRISGGFWPEPVTRALILPVAAPGAETTSTMLVAGVNPRRELDEDYRHFFDSLANYLATALTTAKDYEEARKRVDALAQVDRAKTTFFSNVSHEFRTPLTLILGPTEELLSGTLGETNEIQRAHLTTLRHNAVRLQKLVNSLLDYARIEAGRIEATYEPVDIGLLTRELASTFCSAVHRAKLLYVMNCPSIEEPVYIDRDMWEKIVLNLLSNALKFTFEGTIEISVNSLDSCIALVVRDTGVGIQAEELPQLFDRFHRVQSSRARTQEGSGIGLALVQELVKLHGGSIQVKSAPAEGTAFTVLIPKGSTHLPKERLSAPRALSSTALGAAPYVEEALRWLPDGDAVEPMALPVSAPVLTEVAAAVSPSAERILVADDNLEMRNYLRRLLEMHWNVTAVEDGARALEVARTQRPDLVLSDVMMPGLDGFELLRKLREDSGTSAIPVILLSARAGEESYIEGMNAGADDYIVKPFGARELVARVKALLDVMRVRRETEQRFRAMADSSPTMVWMTDAAGRTTFLNRTYLEYCGVAAEGALTFDWSKIVHPEDRETYGAAFEAALGKRQTFHERVRLRRFDGQWRWFESRGNPILDDAGNMVAFIGSSPDITEIYESQQASKELAQRKDEFLANMSHEIRSPLTGIMGYADILLTQLKDPEHIHCLKTIKQNGDYLIEIVNDILDLSKIEAGKLVLNIEGVSAHAVLGEIHGLMDLRAREKKLPLILRYDGVVPPSIQTDRTRLRQIVINLVSNAIKFTEHGRVEIVARFLKDDGLLQVEVIDTGIGIAPEHQARLFEPFTQADTSSTRQYGGTGLGLTITRRLVEMLGGTLSFESELGQGSTFRVTIPTASPTQQVALPVDGALALDPALGELPLRDRHVLVVDDRKEFCYLLSRYIEDAGGRTTAVSNGEAAIEAIEAAETADPFHAVVMDIQMPGIDGYEATRRIRAKGFQTPIIALTAGAMVGDKEKCLQAGCDEYLTKPIDRHALIKRIAHYVEEAAQLPSRVGGNLKVLLVDDSHASCELLRRFLAKRGYETRSAHDGESALRVARQFRPDAVILDIRLPDMNGYDLLRRLKETDGLRAGRFIAVSGYRDEDAPGDGAIEFDHFLEKPLDMARLEALLHPSPGSF